MPQAPSVRPQSSRILLYALDWKYTSLIPNTARPRFALSPLGFITFIMVTTYTISDLAKEFDLTTRAMRFYEDMGLLQPEREGPGGRNRVYSARDRTRLKLTLRAKRLGLSLTEAKEIIDSYDSPRDTAPQLKKFLAVLADHRKKIEAQLVDLRANLDELRVHEKEARMLLVNAEKTK